MCCVHCPHICLPWTRRSLQAFYYVGSIVGYIEHNLAIVPSSLCVYANKLAACLWGESFHHLPRAWYPWKAMSMLTLLRVINVYVWVLKRPAYITMKTKKKKKNYNYLLKQALFLSTCTFGCRCITSLMTLPQLLYESEELMCPGSCVQGA